MKPLVGITAQNSPTHGKWTAKYIDWLNAAGLAPVVIPWVHDHLTLMSFASRLDGLVLTGGDDVHPKRYGQAQIDPSRPTSLLRDSVEINLIEEAEHLDMPILGICRGAQLLNVKHGGTLHQSLAWSDKGLFANHWHPDRLDAHPDHAVQVLDGTKLADIIGRGVVNVNSGHMQGIDRLGKDLAVQAIHTGDGLVEAIAHMKLSWVVGVQWHPEWLPATETSKRLAASFARACETYKEK